MNNSLRITAIICITVMFITLLYFREKSEQKRYDLEYKKAVLKVCEDRQCTIPGIQ